VLGVPQAAKPSKLNQWAQTFFWALAHPRSLPPTPPSAGGTCGNKCSDRGPIFVCYLGICTDQI